MPAWRPSAPYTAWRWRRSRVLAASSMASTQSRSDWRAHTAPNVGSARRASSCPCTRCCVTTRNHPSLPWRRRLKVSSIYMYISQYLAYNLCVKCFSNRIVMKLFVVFKIKCIQLMYKIKHELSYPCFICCFTKQITLNLYVYLFYKVIKEKTTFCYFLSMLMPHINVIEGNLCRCTGYRPILDGFRTFTKVLMLFSVDIYHNNLLKANFAGKTSTLFPW